MAISVNIKLMKIKFKVNFNSLILVILASLFFIATSSFNFSLQDDSYTKWTSPDESANYFFSKRFSEGKSLGSFDEAAIIGDNMVMPRSFRSDFGWLKPVSFLGIILIYGFLASFLGSALIPFFTPLLAALGILIYYEIVRRVFNKRIALISSALLTFFPVYIYYSVRSMFHNVLFIVLLLLGIYFLILAAKERKPKQPVLEKAELDSHSLASEDERGEVEELKSKNKFKTSFKAKFLNFKLGKEFYLKLLYAFLAGVFLGLTFITRLSELIWLLPALFIAWLFYFKSYSFSKIILIVAGVFLAIIPNLYFNQLLYSAPLRGGYNEMNRSLDDISEAGSGIVQSVIKGGGSLDYLKTIYHNIFYFGFDYEQSLQMAEHYIIEMFPILSLLFVLGFVLVVVRSFFKFEKKHLVYFLIFAVLSTILIFYYGSWQFNDNPDPNRFTIGNSYTRYWLPIYLMMIPIASFLIYHLTRAFVLAISGMKSFKSKKIISALQLVVVIIISLISLDFVLFGSEEGLVHLYYNNLREREYIEDVRAQTEENSIIITKYYDKFLFPERRVIMGTIPNDELLIASAKLVKYYPLYYYNFSLPAEAVDYLNERKLNVYDLKMTLLKRINHDFSLYTLQDSAPEGLATSTMDMLPSGLENKEE